MSNNQYTCRISRKVSGLVLAQCVEVDVFGTGYTKADAMDSLRMKLGDVLREDKPRVTEAADSPLGGAAPIMADLSQQTYDKLQALATRQGKAIEQVAGEAIFRAVQSVPAMTEPERRHWLSDQEG